MNGLNNMLSESNFKKKNIESIHMPIFRITNKGKNKKSFSIEKIYILKENHVPYLI